MIPELAVVIEEAAVVFAPLIATATNTAGDQLTKYSVASTTAATTTAAPTKRAIAPCVGNEIHYGIFDMIPGMEEDRTVTEKMPFSEEELWREIHNQKLLEKR